MKLNHITAGAFIIPSGILTTYLPGQNLPHSEHRSNPIRCFSSANHGSRWCGGCCSLTRGTAPLSKFKSCIQGGPRPPDNLGRYDSGWGAWSSWIAEGFMGRLGSSTVRYSRVSEADVLAQLGRLVGWSRRQSIGQLK